MTRGVGLTLLIAATLLACGGGRGGGTPTAPSPPSPPGPILPPSIDLTGLWFGDLSDSAPPTVGIGRGKSVWRLTLDGNRTTGTATFTWCCHPDGPVFIIDVAMSGTLSADTLYFAARDGRGCSATLTGAANVTDTAITGTYGGSNVCGGGAITNGRISLSRPTLTGTWLGEMGAAQHYSREVSWQLTASGNVVTGSISNWHESARERPSVSGTFSNTTSILTFTSSYPVNRPTGGACLETLNGTARLDVTYIVPNFRPPIPDTPTFQLSGTFTGGNCDFPITNGSFGLTKNT